jgi:two-component system LytT family response regulator
MKKITALLVDDMPAALDLLTISIEQSHKEIEIIGKAKSVVEAAKLLRKISPDILFLDIMLGDGTGFDLLEIFPNLNSKIIFVTASDEFAIRAFKFAAIDYILKPYTEEDLAKAIARAKQQIQPSSAQINVLKESLSANTTTQKITLHSLDKITVVALKDIIRCESDNNNTIFHINDGQKIFITKTLKYYSDMFKGNNFLRVHQSHLVNLNYIKAYVKTEGGYLLLKNDEHLPVSVRKKNEVIEILSKGFG